jgi:hypothetical protein
MVHDCSRPHLAQTNISQSNSRLRLATSICLSRNSPPQSLQRDEGGGSTMVRIRVPSARHALERVGALNSTRRVAFGSASLMPRRAVSEKINPIA